MPFGQFWDRFGAKRGLKHSKKRSGVIRFSVFLLFAAARFRKSFREAFWRHFGLKNEAKIMAKTTPKTNRNLKAILEAIVAQKKRNGNDPAECAELGGGCKGGPLQS